MNIPDALDSLLKKSQCIKKKDRNKYYLFLLSFFILLNVLFLHYYNYVLQSARNPKPIENTYQTIKQIKQQTELITKPHYISKAMIENETITLFTQKYE
jgi:hypothetical protein